MPNLHKGQFAHIAVDTSMKGEATRSYRRRRDAEFRTHMQSEHGKAGTGTTADLKAVHSHHHAVGHNAYGDRIGHSHE